MDLFATAGAGTTSVEETVHSKQTLGTTSHAYQCIDSPLALSLLLEKLHTQKSVCFDTETTSLNALQAELVGIAFSWENHKGYYLPFPADQEEAQKLIEQVRPFFEHPDIEKIGHNLKYDLKVLSNYKLGVKGPLYDTLIAHYLINPDRRHGMDILAASYLNYEPKPITDLIGKKGKNQGSMRDVSLKDQTQYAVEDADITWQLKQHFRERIDCCRKSRFIPNS